MICQNCGNENPSNFKFCIMCGKSLDFTISKDKICLKCNNPNPPNAKFCNNCASNLSNSFSFPTNNEGEELRRELEKLKFSGQIYQEKKKSNKSKWIVVGLAVFIVFSVIIGGLFLMSYYADQNSKYIGNQQLRMQSEAALGSGLQIISMADDGTNYYVTLKNTSNLDSINVKNVSINPGGAASITNSNISPGATVNLTIYPKYFPSTGKTRTFTIYGYMPS